ncbi:centrosomal protein of 72 kDa [Rhinolophus ferrumequinum]|uniref:centrosomal protein of 72 kDa n=1 Tax=Rhinolophus ferrumequinum TaxID=59479 RepID=UPI00140F71E6|nr:centrosomal protein of 72 kDa [Rhinolophus ferrumequinum]
MAPAGPRLVLCEQKIREQSGLAPHRDLAELRSLSIPGTYQEKITHLGNSLMNLTGLKSLDLSRNSLVSLEGIQHLIALERLSLYHNCVSSLAEVLRLRSLPELRDVDLRLNPVVKNEPGYRHFVVHALPKLRQLDDRPVRESEREASWLHFASEGSLDSTQSLPAVGRAGRPFQSRAKCTDPSAKKGLVVDVDDEAVLSLLAECEWDLSNPPGSTSSSQKEREADFHRPQESRHLLNPQSVQHQCGDSIKKGHERRKGGSRGSGAVKPQNLYHGEPSPQHGDQVEARRPLGPYTHFSPHPDATDVEDSAPSSQKSSLSAQNVFKLSPAPEKYRKQRVPGGRSQVPAAQACVSCLEGGLRGHSGSQGSSQTACSPSEASEPGEQRPLGTHGSDVSPKQYPARKATLEVMLLEVLLDLVDRYWSGCKSLHNNEAFLAQARRILSSAQEFAAAQDNSTILNEEISSLTLENKALHNRLAEQQQQYGVKMSEVASELSSTRKEMDDLRQHLDRSLEENSSLKSLLFSMKEVRSADTSATLNVQITGLQTGVQRLSGEVMALQQHQEHCDEIRELTRMLQESHSSLVSTNEHLLQELGRARALHGAEVQQLHWSYQALKRTLGLSPHGSAHPPCAP